MSEEVKNTISELRELRDRAKDQPVDLSPPYVSVRVDHLEWLLSAMPGPDVVAIFPQGMNLAYIPDLQKAFGPGLTVSPYIGGGWKVTKPQ